MKEYEFHELANVYPLLEGIEYDDFKKGIQEAGRIREPIVIYQKKILDGRNRYRAGKELGLKIPTRVFIPKKEGSPELFVQNANEDRRHEKQEILRRRRQERIERITAARQNGESIRTIAENEGVSYEQVRRDIEDSSGDTPPVSPENDPDQVDNSTTKNGTVQGRDGKSYPAKKPKKSGKKKEPKPEPEYEPTPPTDAIGLPVPDKLVPVFEARELFAEAKSLHRQLTAKINEIALIDAVSNGHLATDLSRREREGKAYFRSTDLEAVKTLIEDWEPYVACCPWCLRENNGKPQKSCKGCYGQNWIPHVLWRRCPEESRARVERLVEK